MSKNPTPCTAEDTRPTLPAPTISTESVKRGTVRPSKMGKRRAWVLLFIHVAAFAHILHWQLSGETMSPLEPSEAMYTIARGVVNAGAILLLVSILSTLVLGRWFCGWACHLVALQDGSSWLLKKMGIVPKPIKSRWLMWVPLLAGLHMFLFPMVFRIYKEIQAPELSNGLTKTEFWETFPGFWVGALTFLVCGFGTVYLLGAKGFCTYACPYGGLFGVADRFAPGRIRVTDACKGCGHCTAVCTSNVLVSEEVHSFGMVVDAGCMKCMDCVSVCPEEALYFGFGAPAVLTKSKLKHPKPKKRSFTLRQEIALVALFIVTLVVIVGLPEQPYPWATSLYHNFPLLFALGTSALSAFLVFGAWRLLRSEQFSWQSWRLKTDGNLSAKGKTFLAVALLWILFLGHSSVVQFMTWKGQAEYAETQAGEIPWRQEPAALAALPESVREAAKNGESWLAKAEAWSLFGVPQIAGHRAWMALIRGEVPAASEHLRRAAELAPDHARFQYLVGRSLALEGKYALADARFRRAQELSSEALIYHQPWRQAASEFAQAGRFDVIVGILSQARTHSPERQDLADLLIDANFQISDTQTALLLIDEQRKTRPNDLALILQSISIHLSEGRPDVAKGLLPEALRLLPPDAQVRFALDRLTPLLAAFPGEAIPQLRTIIEQQPERVGPRILLMASHTHLKDWKGAERVVREMITKWPKDGLPNKLLGDLKAAQNQVDAARAQWQKAFEKNPRAFPLPPAAR